VSERALRDDLEAVQAELRLARVELAQGFNAALVAELGAARGAVALGQRAHDEAGRAVAEAAARQLALAATVTSLRERLRRQEQQQLAGLALLAVSGVVALVLASTELLLTEQLAVRSAAIASAAVLGAWAGLRLFRRPDPSPVPAGDRGYALGAGLTAGSLLLAVLGVLVTLSSPARTGAPLLLDVLVWAAGPLAVVGATTWALVREPLSPSRPGLVLAQLFGVLSLAGLTFAAVATWSLMRAGHGAMDQAHRVIGSGLLLAFGAAWVLLGQTGMLRLALLEPLERAGAAVRTFLAVGLLAALSAWCVHGVVLDFASDAHQAWLSGIPEYDLPESIAPSDTDQPFSDAYRMFASRSRYPLGVRQSGALRAALPVYLLAALVTFLSLLASARLAAKQRSLPRHLRWAALLVSLLAASVLAADVLGKLSGP